jgi:hypothetical protein
VTLTLSDKMVGAGGVAALGGLPLGTLTDSPDFLLVERRRLGDDRLVRLWRTG